MKNALLICITLFFSTGLSCQISSLFDDFEGNGQVHSWIEDSLTLNNTFSNPYSEKINISKTLLEYKDTGGKYANVSFQTNENFDLTSNSMFSLKIYVPSNSISGAQQNQISLKLQNGNSQLPWTTQSEIIKPIILDTWQQVHFNFASDNYINLDKNSPAPIKRSDFNRVVLQVNSENNKDLVTAYIDDFYYQSSTSAETMPSANASTPPARNQYDLISIFSDAYENIPNVNFNPDWNQNTTVDEAFQIVSESQNTSLEYSDFDYQGTTWGDTPQDISEMEFLHFDIWTNDSSPRVYVISSGNEIPHQVASQPGSWKSVNIPISGITGDVTNAREFKFSNGDGGKIYIDNLYFWKEAEICEENLNSDTFNNSNLPIIVIETVNRETIPDEPKILGTMKIIERPNGERNFICDVDNEDFLNYSGTIGIEVRGSSSQTLDKKPYGIDTLEDDGTEDKGEKLLGMPKEDDWVLNSFAFDDSMMRDYVSYEMARKMGQYAVNLKYCEVVLNGEYIGLYALSEKIKRDGDRVNIAKLSDDDNTFPDITGGYLIQTDRPDDEDPEAWYNNGAGYIHEKPNFDDITTEQSNYIENIFRDLDRTATNSSVPEGFPAVIDVPSFVDYMLMAEIASNVDAYALSTYYHKDRGGKLRAGPIWDYNLTFGNDLFNAFSTYFDRSHSDVWQFNYSNTGAYFWNDLFSNTAFKCYLAKRFDAVTKTGEPLNYAYISDLMDTTVVLISEAVEREHKKWNTIEDFPGEIRAMKSWIQERIGWMRDNLGQFSNCNAISVPSLTITKIHYNPSETDEFSNSDDSEFIEIQNTGNTTVDLTGVHLSKLGLSYQFPKNKMLIAGQTLKLARNSDVFKDRYGVDPFDSFSTDLSNSSQNLTLSDAFGNLIDQVIYSDDAPWPETADGDGFYLELIDYDADNSLPINWKASAESTLNREDFNHKNIDFTMYPNPAGEKIFINSTQTIKNITFFNLLGQKIKQYQLNAESGEINIAKLREGVYFLSAHLIDGTRISKKIFKK
jgi:hypothetical protein